MEQHSFVEMFRYELQPDREIMKRIAQGILIAGCPVTLKGHVLLIINVPVRAISLNEMESRNLVGFMGVVGSARTS